MDMGLGQYWRLCMAGWVGFLDLEAWHTYKAFRGKLQDALGGRCKSI
jgi:hypothetical protein